MAKVYSKKFWFIFWTVSILFLVAFYFFLQVRNNGAQNFVDALPIDEKYKSVAYFTDYILTNDDKEKTFLLLFQNNMEIRPGGGFIGSFGILKVKNGKIAELQIHDTGNFDGRVPATVPAPYPMFETLHIKSLQMRDSNYSPDFVVNAEAAEKFYYMGQGQEKFDGVAGITTNVLMSFLKATGPVEIPGYPGTYGDENAVIALEYQVEKAFDEQGIARGDRKDVINDLAKIILQKVETMGVSQKIEFAKIIFEDLNKKDIQLYFHDPVLQAKAEQAGWAGEVDQKWNKDYLMAVDANLGAWKTDRVMKRSLDYSIDLSSDTPKAVLKITYENTAKVQDFMTKNYLSYLRVYLPEGAWMTGQKNFDNTQFGEDLGKKYLGAIVYVPLGTSKTVEINYTLPKEIAAEYDLKIQKQAGINDVLVAVHVKNVDGSVKDYNYTMNSDFIWDKQGRK